MKQRRPHAWGDPTPYTPRSVRPKRTGLRPSVEGLVGKIDPEDPAFAQVAAILIEMRTSGVEIDEAAVEIALRLGRQRQAADDHSRAKANARPVGSTPLRLWPEENGRSSIVYYLRRADLIKIGTTVRPEQRFRDLIPDEILAWEPGGRHEEVTRHRQFRHLQERGEYFRPGRELVRHCKRIRTIHGEPDPRWTTTAHLRSESRQDGVLPLPSELPLPTSPTMVNATQAAAATGVSRGTIGSWVSRKQLLPVAFNGARPLFYLDHVRYLKERSRSRRDTA